MSFENLLEIWPEMLKLQYVLNHFLKYFLNYFKKYVT